jgi:hypothetical protein
MTEKAKAKRDELIDCFPDKLSFRAGFREGYYAHAEEAKILVEALEFYAVHGLAKIKWGDPIDPKLCDEFYINGGLAREALAKYKGDTQ